MKNKTAKLPQSLASVSFYIYNRDNNEDLSGVLNSVEEEPIVTFQQLQYVSEVAHLGSINKAAQKLYVSQSGISTSIKLLEEELQIQIFSRSASGICLTPDGKEFLAHARSMLDYKSYVENLFQKSGNQRGHRLTVAAQHLAFPVQALTGIINDLNGSDFEVCIKELLIQELLEDVLHGKSDVGVMFLSNVMNKLLDTLEESRGLEFHEMCRIRPKVCIRPEHPLAHLDQVSISDLAPYPYLAIFQDYSSPFDHIEEIRLLSRNAPTQVIYTTDRATIYDIILSTNAYHICSGMRTERESASTKLLDIIDYKEELRFGWFKHSRSQLSQEASIFLERLTQVVNEWDNP